MTDKGIDKHLKEWNTMKTIYQSRNENRPSLMSLGAELHSWLIKMILSI